MCRTHQPAQHNDTPTGSLFLAVDGTTGLVWNHLNDQQVADALTLVTDLAFLPVAATNLPDGSLGEAPVIVPLASGTVENLRTTADGLIRLWATPARAIPTHQPVAPNVDTTLGTGLHVVAVTVRLVALLGLPDAADSEAAA